MKILIPTAITAAMIAAGTTVAEPAASETAWVSAGTYVVGDLRIRTTTHRVYKCVAGHTGRTALPEADTAYWLDFAPTQRWAPFDIYTTTAATGTTSMTYVLSPGFMNASSLYGLVGSDYTFTVKDAPGGATLFSRSGDLFAQAIGLYELLFVPLLQIDKLVFSDIPISPTAELTVTVTAAASDPVEIAMINVGDLRAVIGAAEWGGTEYGASADPKSYSYIKVYDDGTMDIVRRGKATDMIGTVVMPKESAQYAVETIQQALDIPVSCIAATVDGYAYLNVFGLISGSVVASSPGHAKLNYSVKGFI
jgi:hypothetical protein